MNHTVHNAKTDVKGPPRFEKRDAVIIIYGKKKFIGRTGIMNRYKKFGEEVYCLVKLDNGKKLKVKP